MHHSHGEYQITARPLPSMMCGENIIERIGSMVKSMQCDRAFIVTDPGLKAAGVADRVAGLLEAASLEIVVYDQVPANPTFESVAAGIAMLAGRFERTAVVSLGGGSSMDAAKAIAVIGPQCGTIDAARAEAWTRDVAASLGDFTFYPRLSHDGENMDVATMRPKRVGKLPSLPIIVRVVAFRFELT